MSTNYYLVSIENESKIQNILKNINMQQEKIIKLQKNIDELMNTIISNDKNFNINIEMILKNYIDELNQNKESTHIGKFSSGWRFIFNKDNFNGLKDFIVNFDKTKYIILDEYWREISIDEFSNTVISSLKSPIRNHDGKELFNIELPLNASKTVDEHNMEGFRLVSGDFS